MTITAIMNHNYDCPIFPKLDSLPIFKGKSYRKIHYLTCEFRVKLHLKTNIGFRVQFNAEFTSKVLNFP